MRSEKNEKVDFSFHSIEHGHKMNALSKDRFH